MGDYNIEDLARKAEKGDGCSLLEDLRAAPFEMVVKIMKQIEDRNAADLAKAPTLHRVTSARSANNFSVSTQLFRANPNARGSGSELLTIEIGLNDNNDKKVGQKRVVCSDLQD